MCYQYQKSDAYGLARHVGADVKQKDDELQFKYCPLCGGGEHKDKYTFSVNINTGMFKCMRASCSEQGGFTTLAKKVGFPLDFGTKEPLKKNYSKLPQRKVKDIVIRDKAIEYMASRGIPEEIVRKFGITTQKDRTDILVFPFYDWNGNLTMVKYRNTKFQKGDYGSKEWVSKDTKPILFGMNNVNYENDTLVITEGQIDSLSLTAAGIENAVSVPMGKNNFNWINTCWDFLHRFKKIVVFGDNENGEITLAKEITSKLKRHQMSIVKPESYLCCKDANDMLKKYGKGSLVQAVANAEKLKVNHIVSLADVKAVDLSQMPHFSTGLAEIDKLTGGMFNSQLIILSGKRGEGKSTLASQMVIEAVDQDKPTLVYSGELPNYQFKNWLDLQAAGVGNITPSCQNGREYYSISSDVQYKINEWYRDLLYIVDNDMLSDGENMMDIIETAIYRYNIKFCLVDNLMCLAEYGNDIYQEQGKIVKRLKEISVAADCVIMLITHERKQKSMDLSDNISGSADITNRADVVIKYSRNYDNSEPCDGFIEIPKNRLFGDLALKSAQGAIKTYFDKASRRISTDRTKSVNKAYGWENNHSKQVVHIETDDGDLPF